VTVPIEQSAGFAEKIITVDWSGDPAFGYRLLNIGVDPPSVLIEGPPEVVNELTSLQTEPIDITGLTESFIQQATLALPEGITLDQNQEIFVTVGIEPIMSTDTRRQEVEVLGLDEDLEAQLDPDHVGVVLFGPLPALGSLVANDVRVTVDLIGRNAGQYSIEPEVDIPDRGIEVRSVEPSAISVFITKTLTTTLDITGTLQITGTPGTSGTVEPLLTNSTPISETNLIPPASFTHFESGDQGGLSRFGPGKSLFTHLNNVWSRIFQTFGLISPQFG
jgi:hypothetical protein